MNPDERNMEDKSYDVRVYLNSNVEYVFPARNLHNAREIAKRIITEGVHIINDWGVLNHPDLDNTEVFYPTHQIYKVKIIKKGN